MAAHENDETVLARINRLIAEQRELWNTTERDSHADARLAAVGVELDQLWDLLRQRDALREFGDDPDRAQKRSPLIVEKYIG